MDLRELSSTLRHHAEAIPALRVITGFDGFVDEMITAVDQRHDLNTYQRVETIDQFGDLIKAASGHSSLREIVVTRADPGGCAINMGDGLASLGVDVTTFATTGAPSHPAFAEYAKKATLHSWGREPGRTLAFEFADGKLMFSSVTQLADFTPEDVIQRLACGEFLQACQSASLIGITDWTLYPHMTACWRTLQKEVFSQLTHRPRFFFDLVDPVSRTAEDIADMLIALRGFCDSGPVTLGLNQNEANLLSKVSHTPLTEVTEANQALDQAEQLRRITGVDEVVVHAVDYAVCATQQDHQSVRGPYCSAPTKLTGAGDRFNAGYALGCLLDLPTEGRLLLATATSGLYVRKGTSASLAELLSFLDRWAEAPASLDT